MVVSPVIDGKPETFSQAHNRSSARTVSGQQQLARRIILVRHGPSAHVMHGAWTDRAGVEHWRDAYDAAGIELRAQPPAHLMRLVADVSQFVASDFNRATMSASRLAGGRAVVTSSLLREVPLPIPHWFGRLPLAAWGALIHFNWLYGIARGREHSSQFDARVSDAVAWLLQITDSGSSVCAVTHGVVRRMIGQQLCRLGWTPGRRHNGYRPWSAWEFTKVHEGS